MSEQDYAERAVERIMNHCTYLPKTEYLMEKFAQFIREETRAEIKARLKRNQKEDEKARRDFDITRGALLCHRMDGRLVIVCEIKNVPGSFMIAKDLALLPGPIKDWEVITCGEEPDFSGAGYCYDNDIWLAKDLPSVGADDMAERLAEREEDEEDEDKDDDGNDDYD